MYDGRLFPCGPDPIRWWGQNAPDRLALVDRVRDERLTYAELDAAADRWKGVLLSSGVARGDRVAAISGNRTEVVALYAACTRLGAALVPLNWRLSAPELARVIGNARPRLLVGEARFRRATEQTSNDVRWLDLDAEAPALLARSTSNEVDARIGPDDAAMILYTSGSTGHPKGAILPHRQILYNAIATTTGWELGADDIAPISTPFFHTGGWHVFATPLWQRGGRVVLMEQFDPETFLETLDEERCTIALTVPTQMVMLLESAAWGRPLPHLKRFVSGGAPCPPTVMERVRSAGFDMREGFGLTEFGPNCFTISAGEAVRRVGSVGRPMPFVEMRLVTDDGGDAEPDEAGELCLRGPQIFGGYFDDPVRTAEAIDSEGWLHTGDLASRDEDGYFRIRGRKKDMFISGGENVYPGEVEAAITECAGVAEVIVVGVPDEKWGEVGRAFVVRRRGMTITTQAVLAHARACLAGYKVPKSVIVTDDLPRLGSGKIDRRALAERGLEALQGVTW